MGSRSLTHFLVFGVCFLIFLVFCWGVVSSMDLMRKELEEVRAQLRTMNETLADLPHASLAPSRSGPDGIPAESEAANARYYDPRAEQGGRIVHAIPADSGNLNMILMNEATVSEFWDKAMDSLAAPDYDDPDEYRGLLAESWSVSPDNLIWRIRLREGILWHDFTDPVTGKEWKNVPVTAHDFKFYVDVIKDETVDSAPMRSYLSSLREIRVLNDREFEVVWDKPYFKSKDITLGLIPLPRHFYAPDGKFSGKDFNVDSARNRMIVGCGPYQFVEWKPGRSVRFKRFEKYYGRRLGIMPPVREIAFEVIKHPGTRLQSLKSKEIDILSLQPNQWVENTSGPEFGKDGFLDRVRYPNQGYHFIGLNFTHPILRDKLVRQGLSCLVDRDRLLRDVYSNLSHPVTGPFFYASPASDPDVKPYPFSVEKARSLFEKAGWRDTDGDGILDRDGKPLQFTVLYPNTNAIAQKVLSILREDMARAGVRLEMLALEWSVVCERLDSRNFEACMIGWTGTMRPDPYQIWHSAMADSPQSSNFISFRNEEADRLIDAIRIEFDDEKRNELYHRFHRLIHEEAPYIFLFSTDNLVAISRRYRNRRTFPLGIPEHILWVPKAEQMRMKNP